MEKDNKLINYNYISQFYDVSRATNAKNVEKIFRLLHVDCDSVLLDLGCGTGNYTAALQQLARSVIGIDISIGMIEQALSKFPSIRFICGDITCLPFNTETFAGAFVIGVLHHVKKKEIFLREAYRVIHRDAYIAIHFCSHRQMQAFWFYSYFPKGLEVDLSRIPDSEDIISLLERVGFSNVNIEICYYDVGVAYETPECYLDKNYRDSISTFSLLTEKDIKLGCEKLKEDIASGAVEKVVQQSEWKVTNKVGGSTIIYGRKPNSLL